MNNKKSLKVIKKKYQWGGFNTSQMKKAIGYAATTGSNTIILKPKPSHRGKEYTFTYDQTRPPQYGSKSGNKTLVLSSIGMTNTASINIKNYDIFVFLDGKEIHIDNVDDDYENVVDTAVAQPDLCRQLSSLSVTHGEPSEESINGHINNTLKYDTASTSMMGRTTSQQSIINNTSTESEPLITQEEVEETVALAWSLSCMLANGLSWAAKNIVVPAARGGVRMSKNVLIGGLRGSVYVMNQIRGNSTLAIKNESEMQPREIEEHLRTEAQNALLSIGWLEPQQEEGVEPTQEEGVKWKCVRPYSQYATASMRVESCKTEGVAVQGESNGYNNRQTCIENCHR